MDVKWLLFFQVVAILFKTKKAQDYMIIMWFKDDLKFSDIVYYIE